MRNVTRIAMCALAAGFLALGCVGEEPDTEDEYVASIEQGEGAAEPDCAGTWISTTTTANDDDCHYVCTVGAGFQHGQLSRYYPAQCFCHSCGPTS